GCVWVASGWMLVWVLFFFSSRRRHTRLVSDWSSDVCSSDLQACSASPCANTAPSFWIDQRLAQVKTRVWNAAAVPAAYKDVEQWTLTHSFPDPGDGSRAGLWLASIAHSGLVGGTATVPNVTFQPTPMNNRVDTALING